jgi:anti-sigma regulatory factor (Ser/Thr protein kinase)
VVDTPLLSEELTLPAEAASLGLLQDALDGFVGRALAAGLIVPDGTRWLFATAVGEIAANIVRHAYPPGVAGPTMSLAFRLFPDRIEGRFVDQGIRYWKTGELPPVSLADWEALPESGYGLAMAKAALTELSYRRLPDGQNRWDLVKVLGKD